MTDTNNQTRTKAVAIGGVAVLALGGAYWAFSPRAEAPAVSTGSSAEELHASLAEFSYSSGAQDFPYGRLIDGLDSPASALLTPTTFAAYEPVKLEDGAYRILLIDVVLADTPIDSLSFLAKGIDDNSVQISDLSVNSPLTLGEGEDAATLSWSELDWTGTYDLVAQTYIEHHLFYINS